MPRMKFEHVRLSLTEIEPTVVKNGSIFYGLILVRILQIQNRCPLQV